MLLFVLNLIRQKQKRIIGGIVLFTFIFIFALALNYFFVKKTVPTTYSSEIQMTLPRAQGYHTYYSGAFFSCNDIIAPDILMMVYDKLNLERFLSKKEFLSNVSIMETTPKLLEAEATYRSSLAAPRLTPPQIADIIQTYQKALEQLSIRQYQIQLTTHLPKSVAIKILEMIPNCWADAKKAEMLRQPTAFWTQQKWDDLGIFEKIELLGEQYRRLSSLLVEMQGFSKNDRLTLDSGENLTDLQHELDLFCGRNQLMLLRRTIIRNGSFSEQDKQFVTFKLNELLAERARQEQLLKILEPPLFLEPNKSIQTTNASDQETLINVSGLDMLVNLALRHAQQTQQLYNRYMQVGEELAEIHAAIAVYSQMEKAITDSGADSAKSGMKEDHLLARIIARENVCLEKVKQMRQKLLASYRNTQFFLPNSPVGQRKESCWLLCNPRDYFHAGLLWLVCCLGYVACLVLPDFLKETQGGMHS